MHKHTGNYPYNCEFCGKGFAGKSQYRYHALRHSGQCPFICKECGGRFWRKRNLEVQCTKHRCDDAPPGFQRCAVSCTLMTKVLLYFYSYQSNLFVTFYIELYKPECILLNNSTLKQHKIMSFLGIAIVLLMQLVFMEKTCNLMIQVRPLFGKELYTWAPRGTICLPGVSLVN